MCTGIASFFLHYFLCMGQRSFKSVLILEFRDQTCSHQHMQLYRGHRFLYCIWVTFILEMVAHLTCTEKTTRAQIKDPQGPALYSLLFFLASNKTMDVLQLVVFCRVNILTLHRRDAASPQRSVRTLLAHHCSRARLHRIASPPEPKSPNTVSLTSLRPPHVSDPPLWGGRLPRAIWAWRVWLWEEGQCERENTRKTMCFYQILTKIDLLGRNVEITTVQYYLQAFTSLCSATLLYPCTLYIYVTAPVTGYGSR